MISVRCAVPISRMWHWCLSSTSTSRVSSAPARRMRSASTGWFGSSVKRIAPVGQTLAQAMQPTQVADCSP